MQADGLIGGEPPVPDGLDRLRDKVNALDSKRKVNGDENKFKAMSLRHICGLKGQESPGFSLGNISIDERPHKALPSSALLEKHPVRRVGGAEGAAE
ncbi:MAG: hypothetical protein QOG92_2117, partial [Verrucomicrobiota bacterium]|nr:hypothetical protein [Verrucomicrobiota bacterium]